MGTPFFQADFIFALDFHFFTDAAWSKGFGAIWKSHWCCAAWPESWVKKQTTKNMVLLESFPILVTLVLWGPDFVNRQILVEINIRWVLYAVNCLSSSFLLVIKVLRRVVFLYVKCNIWLKAKYTTGILNNVADLLSRFQMDLFQQLLPEANEDGTKCPKQLWEVIWLWQKQLRAQSPLRPGEVIQLPGEFGCHLLKIKALVLIVHLKKLFLLSYTF